MTTFVFTVYVLGSFLLLSVLGDGDCSSNSLLDTPTPADIAMLQVANCTSGNLLTAWIIEATLRIRARPYSCRIPWSHFLLNIAYKVMPF